jgi:RNA polymerase sigma-70 factor (ECF subfamily)
MPPTDAELQSLYAQYAPVIHRRCRSILGNEEDACDAVQETFSRVIVHWESFRGEASPLTWMYRISTNYCLNRIRNRRSRADKRHVHREDIVSTSFDRGGQRWEEGDTARRLLELADEQERAIVIHIFFDDMTREQAAQMAGVSVPTLRKRLNTFLARARKVMESDGFALATGALVVFLAALPLLLSYGGSP